MRTIGGELDKSRGLGPGFDFLRIGLAFAVVTWHTDVVAIGFMPLDKMAVAWFGDYAILNMFFALSGFLIAGSALRLSLSNFIINRSLRIIPALAVEILLSAGVLGTLFTSLPMSQYFSDWHTYHYLTNIVGLINFELPGVFKNNPVDLVNVSLWTVPFEIGCYVIMSGLIALSLLKRPSSLLIFAAVMLVVGLVMVVTGFGVHPQGVFQSSLNHLSYGQGSRLFLAFVLGIATYLYRYKLPYSLPLFAVAVLVCLLTAYIGNHDWPHPLVSTVAAVPLVYIVAFIGVSKLPPLPLFHRGDYSYGVYLYGFPIMQAMRGWFPYSGSNPVLLWLMSVPVILLFAAF